MVILTIPAPEPKSTTISPCLMSANFVGTPRQTPSMEVSGTGVKSLLS
jgi:hypothetical protein